MKALKDYHWDRKDEDSPESRSDRALSSDTTNSNTSNHRLLKVKTRTNSVDRLKPNK